MKHCKLLKVCSSSAVLLISCSMASGAEYTLSEMMKYQGACDGSAGVATEDSTGFFSATDEDNALQIYSTESDSKGRDVLDLNGKPGIPDTKKKPGKIGFKELDIEGAAKAGGIIYWITSYGAKVDKDKGKTEQRPERQILFATKPTGTGEEAALDVEGTAYKGLLADLVALSDKWNATDFHPPTGLESLKDVHFGKAAGIAPKEKDALNIEALCWNGKQPGSTELYIGFRNPIPGGKALLLPLTNAPDLVHNGTSVHAEFGTPILLDLRGLGIRDMAWWRGSFLIIAGDYREQDKGSPSQLYQWSGDPAQSPTKIEGIDFAKLGEQFNPEAAVPFGDAKLLLLSDDGTLKAAGIEQKDNLDKTKRYFRGVWLTPSAP